MGDVGVFSGSSDGGLRFDPSSSLPPDLGGHPHSRELYEFFGRFIGKALLERVPLDARLASPIYAQLLGRVVEFEDLRCLDEDLAKNLKWLLHLFFFFFCFCFFFFFFFFLLLLLLDPVAYVGLVEA